MVSLRYVFITTVFSLLAACGGGESDSIPSSSSSSVRAPSSIFGVKLVESLDPNSKKVQPAPGSSGITFANSITYQFIDANTILGEGLLVVPTLSWTYTTSGNVAYVHMQMQYGVTDEVLTFTSNTGGTFTTTGSLISGTKFSYAGTFTVGSVPSGTTGSTTPPTTSSSTGQVAFWSADPNGGTITVNVDGSTVGSLTQYYTSTPTCGGAGTVTKTLTAGSHTLSASASGGTWGPSPFTVTAGGCLTYQLM